MIKRGESQHAYLNNAKDNKWIPSVQSTTSGKAKEKHPREITSLLTTHTHNLTSALKLGTGQKKKNISQITLKCPDMILTTWPVLRIVILTVFTRKHDECLIPWKTVEENPFC